MQISGQVLQVLRLVSGLNGELEELDPKFAYLDYFMPRYPQAPLFLLISLLFDILAISNQNMQISGQLLQLGKLLKCIKSFR